MTWLVRVNVFVVAFIMCAGVVNAFAYRLGIEKSDEKPLFSERISIDSGVSNESAVSREVINHVHHQHQQTIGNVHILTNIDIANLITILNTSAPTTSSTNNGQPTHATDTSTTIMPGKYFKKKKIQQQQKNSFTLITILSGILLSDGCMFQVSIFPSKCLIDIHMFR